LWRCRIDPFNAKANKICLVVPPASNAKQAIEQHFDGHSNLRDQNDSQNTANGRARAADNDVLISSNAPSSNMSGFDLPELSMSNSERSDIDIQRIPGYVNQQMASLEKDDLLNFENTFSFTENNFPHSMVAWGYPPGQNPVRSIPKSVTEERYELYLDHFHHRWPIIHIPSLEKGDDPYVLTASVEMIGAWLHGSCESKMEALTLHDRLTNHIFQRMVCT